MRPSNSREVGGKGKIEEGLREHLPITYQGKDGKQYVAVVAASGGPSDANKESLVVFALAELRGSLLRFRDGRTAVTGDALHLHDVCRGFANLTA